MNKYQKDRAEKAHYEEAAPRYKAVERRKQAALIAEVGAETGRARIRWPAGEATSATAARVERLKALRRRRRTVGMVEARNPTHRAARLLEEET